MIQIGQCEAWDQEGLVWLQCKGSGEYVQRSNQRGDEIRVCLCLQHQDADQISLPEESLR